MLIPKNYAGINQPKGRYDNPPTILVMDGETKSVDLFHLLWEDQCQCKEAKGYVLFLDKRSRLVAWENFTMKDNIDLTAREITGLALICNAKSIILSFHRLAVTEPNSVDAALISKLFKICETVSVKVLDYLIVTPNGHLCHTDWFTAD